MLRRARPSLTELVGKVTFTGEIPRISPDGGNIACLLRMADWKHNSFQQHCYVYSTQKNAFSRLTQDSRTRNLRWLDNNTLLMLKNGQVCSFDIRSLKEQQVTDFLGEVYSFEICGANGVVFLAGKPGRGGKESRENYFGSIEYVEKETSDLALYYQSIKKPEKFPSRDGEEEKTAVEITKNLDASFSIQSFVVSPTGNSVYLNCLPAGTHIYWKNNIAFRVKFNVPGAGVEAVTGQPISITRLDLPPSTEIAAISPQGAHALVRSWGRDPKIYNREDLFIADLRGSSIKAGHSLLEKLDRQPISTYWIKSGIFISYWNRTRIDIARLSEKGQVDVLNLKGIFPRRDFHISPAGHIAFIGGNAARLFELYITGSSPAGEISAPQRVSNISAPYRRWDWGTVETIRWQSSDGVEIEGVLRKPSAFDASKKYPLVFLVHGGPAWADLEFLEDRLELYYYPVLQLLRRGVLVLKPNYRGSRGYGHEFAAAKAGKNLGYVSLWDLEGAIESLSSKGLVDKNKVGVMGWSHGGYIGAFAATHSTAFKAVSVGAGTGSWATYAVNNDISFEIAKDYLGCGPFQPGQEVYSLTAPLDKISAHAAAVLLQHGRNDPVSPLQSAKEFFRGLKELGVQVEFFIFNSMGHGISSPKENRAALKQNLTWFSHFLLGEKLDFFQAETR